MLQELNIAGLSISLYNVFDSLAGITLLGYILFHTIPYRDLISHKKERTQRKTTLLAFIQLVIISALCYLMFKTFNRAFADWFTDGNANYYGNLTAWLIVFLIVPKIFKVSSLQAMDLLSPGLPLSLFVAKLACVFHGCCSGFEMNSSFYFNQSTNRHEFPVQLVEALVAFALFFVIRLYQKRNKIPGSVFPVYLILYSISRFITEFFRADLPNVLGSFDAYQIMSVVFLLVGGGLLYFVWIYKYESDTHNKPEEFKHKR